jgi:hypothetical protein
MWLSDGISVVGYAFPADLTGRGVFFTQHGDRLNMELNVPLPLVMSGFETYLRLGWRPYTPNNEREGYDLP